MDQLPAWHGESLLLPALQAFPSKSVNIIFSRHVLERHSLDGRLMFKLPQYRRAIQENQFHDLPVDFPGSTANLEAILRECIRILDQGGVFVAQIARRKYNPLNSAWFEAAGMQQVRMRDLGRRSQIYSFRLP